MFPAVFRQYLAMRRLAGRSTSDVRAAQDRLLRKTLLHAFDRCPYYRELWTKQGITRAMLPTAPLTILPVVTKRDIMENFSGVVTIPGCTKEELEAFVQGDRGGTRFFRRKYLLLNTSGSSGYVGLFLFTKSFLSRVTGSIIARLVPNLMPYLVRRTRVGFVGEAEGHHAGFNLIENLPALFKTKSVPVEASDDVIAREIKSFRPHVLTGYASGLAHLAEVVAEQKVRLKPDLIISSGEPLSTERENIIRSAFGVPAADFYAATETLALGIDTEGTGQLEIFDELLILEVIDDHGNAVKPGELGRVVVTILGNTVQPLIRYALDDEIVLLPDTKANGRPFRQAEAVKGRALQRLVFETKKGTVNIHPMQFVGLFFPGLKQYQVVQTGKSSATVRLVIDGDPKDVSEQIGMMLPKFLEECGVQEGDVAIKIEIVEDIAPDPNTGKTPLIIPLKA